MTIYHGPDLIRTDLWDQILAASLGNCQITPQGIEVLNVEEFYNRLEEIDFRENQDE